VCSTNFAVALNPENWAPQSQRAVLYHAVPRLSSYLGAFFSGAMHDRIANIEVVLKAKSAKILW
jgi:hypothetical protein